MTRLSLCAGAVFVTLVLVVPIQAYGAEIRDYSLRLRIDAAGGAVVAMDVEAVIADGDLVVPLAYPDGTDLHVITGPANATMTLLTRDGRGALMVAAPASPEPQRISVEFRVPGVMAPPGAGGHRVVRHQLLNTQRAPIPRYVVDVVFPDGWRAHAIREGAPRVRIEEIAGARGARFEVAALKQGESATMRIEMVPVARSWSWLVVGLLLAAGYLISFRDLVKPAGR
jgi:hypothetical protein